MNHMATDSPITAAKKPACIRIINLTQVNHMANPGYTAIVLLKAGQLVNKHIVFYVYIYIYKYMYIIYPLIATLLCT